MIREARGKGRGALLGAFLKLSGPGWLQSAITLGGGSLANALYLGVLGGFAFMWLQPLAMIMGVIMLSAIGYVSLSTGEKPFQAINNHINPVLGWGWLVATLLANCVWSLPQFNLATAATRQNLLPGVFGAGAMSDKVAAAVICLVIAVICTVAVWSYDSSGKGRKVFDWFLKGVVGLIVVSFFGVVVKLSLAQEGGLDWGQIRSGFIPNLKLLSNPAATFAPHLDAVGDSFRGFWETIIVSQQRDVMIGAAATAVGINMTFLLPYSMLKRGWDSDFRGLAIFDLATGLFIPFLLVTGCVVIVSASQFHAQPAECLLDGTATGGLKAQYEGLAARRLGAEIGPEAMQALTPEAKAAAIAALPEADRRMAAMLVKRDANQLALSLAPLTGDVVANAVFGVGVVGMAVSSIIILMLINGFVICEMLGRPLYGKTYRFGSMLPLLGVLGPFVWGAAKARFWLAVPTSVFGMVLLPIAYFTFFLMMNQKSLLKDNMPTGGKRIAWNLLMALAAGLASFGSIWSLWSKLRWTGIAILVGFILLAVVVQFVRRGKGDYHHKKMHVS
jgi:hypothetical protein